MKINERNPGLIGAAVVMASVLLCGATVAAAANNTSAPQGGTWASIAKLPDWSATWALTVHDQPTSLRAINRPLT